MFCIAAGFLETMIACCGEPQDKKEETVMLDRTSLILTIIGAINWLLVGLFQFDLVAYICGGQDATISRIIYTIVGVAGLWCISLLFRERHNEDVQGVHAHN